MVAINVKIKTILFVIILISALAMTGLTVSYGRIRKETEIYDKLSKSGLTNYLYASKIKPDSDLIEKIKGINGVTDVIQRPDTVSFTVSERPDEIYSMKLYTKAHIDGAGLIMKGGGFDYNSARRECIIACEQFKNLSVGDTLSVNISGKGKTKGVTVDFHVSGVLEFPQSVLSMSGGGSAVDASLLYEDAAFIIVKDQPSLRELIGGGITKSYLETMFIKADGEAEEELSKYVTFESVKQILENTEAGVKTALSGFLPIIIFCVLYSILTLVSMEILISYKTADEISVYRCLGMSRRRLVLIVVISELLIIFSAFVFGAVLSRLVFMIPDISTGMIYRNGLLLPALLLGAAEIIISVLTLTLTHFRKSIRNTYERI